MAIKAPVDELSIDVDSAVASAAPATPNESTQESSDQEDSASSSSAFFGQDEKEDSIQDEAESEDASASDDDDVWEVSALGKTHKVNLREKEKVKRLLSMGLAGPKAFSKVAKLSQENKRLTEELKQADSRREKAELFERLEAIKDDEAELYRVITGGKSLDEIVEQRMQKKQAWAEASPDERRELEAQERERALTARIERMEASTRVEKEESEKKSAKATEDRAYSEAYPEYQSVFKELNIADPIEAQEVATDLWELGWARVARMQASAEEEKKDLDLTPQLLRSVFQATAKRWGYTAKKQAKAEVSKILDKKSKEATNRAGLAATRNYSKKSIQGLEGLSPTKAFEKLFGK